MKPYLSSVGLTLMMTAGLFGADNVLTPQEKAAGWILLFDGKTLNGWDSAVPWTGGQGPGAPGAGAPKQAKAAPRTGGSPAHGSNPRPCSTETATAAVPPGGSHWEVKDGVLSPCGPVSGYLTSKQDYKDLVLTVDFKTGEDTNSGVFIRSPAGKLGYEVQIWKDQPAGYNTGSIVGAGKTDKEYKFIADQWNHYEITADGDRLVVVLNGTKTLDIHDSSFSDGRIRFQYQKYPIEFKNVKMREIKH
jgi:hypothetical protein